MRNTVAACVAALAITFTFSAAAQDPAAGEALFNQATTLLSAGRTDEACAAFGASYRADATLGTLLNLASCHEKQGKVATAWAEFREVERKAARAGQNERSSVAKDLGDKLELRLPRLRVRVPSGIEGLTIKRGATVLDGQLLSTEIPVDLGAHTLLAEAPGRKPWSQTVTVEREATVVEVLVPELEPVGDKPPPHAESGGPSTLSIAGWTLFGGGAAVAIVGGVLGGLTLAEVSDAEEDPSLCPERKCSPAGLDAIDAAEQKGIASTILLAAGGVMAATGIVLVLVPSGGAGSTGAALRLRLAGSSLTLTGSF